MIKLKSENESLKIANHKLNDEGKELNKIIEPFRKPYKSMDNLFYVQKAHGDISGLEFFCEFQLIN